MSSLSEEYLNFRSSVSMKKICIGDDQTWTLYDAGPKSVTSPIIFLPPASGRADVFFMQLNRLSKLGYRAISIEYPVFWTVIDFCLGFNRLLNALQLGKIHLFGSAIGGFLAMKYAQFSKSAKRVQSIVLCNSFTDSSIFCSRFPAIPPAMLDFIFQDVFHAQRSRLRVIDSVHPTFLQLSFPSFSSFWILPSLVLRKMVMSDFKEVQGRDRSTRYSTDFMRHSLDSLTQEELASRLVLNCTNDYVQPQYLRDVSITIIEVNDCEALDRLVTEETSKCFPEARVAHLKSGGNFPFISRCDDINVFIQIHLKPYLAAKDCSPIGQDNILHSIMREAEALAFEEVRPVERETMPGDATLSQSTGDDQLSIFNKNNGHHEGGWQTLAEAEEAKGVDEFSEIRSSLTDDD